MRPDRYFVSLACLCFLMVACNKKDCLVKGNCTLSSYQSNYLIEQTAPLATGSTYFVDAEGGNDTNSGLSETEAWETTAPISDTELQPGDHVYFRKGQIHFGNLSISNSGTDTERIVLSSYGTGDLPVIKHSHKKEITIFLNRSDYITLQNLNIQGGYTSVVLEEADHVIIEGCRLGETSTVGVKASAADGEVDGSDHGIIRHCLIYSGKSGAIGDLQGTDGVQLADGASHWELYQNEIKAWAHTGVNVYQIFSRAEEAWNKIHDNLFTCGDIDYMRAFSFQGGENGPHHNEFYRNTIRDQSVNSHLHGHDNLVYYNYFQNIRKTNASTQPHAVDFHVFKNSQSGAVIKTELVCHDNYFVNNLILNCMGTAVVFFKPMDGTDFTVSTNVVRNNMMINVEAGIALPPNAYQSTIENNLFYNADGSVPMVYDGTNEDLTAFQARNGTNGDIIQGNVEADPKLIINGMNQFQCLPGSPAIDLGIPHAFSSDHYGNPMVGVPDIGLVEAQ